MVRILTVDDLRNLLYKVTLPHFLFKLMGKLEDYALTQLPPHDNGNPQNPTPPLRDACAGGVLLTQTFVANDYFLLKNSAQYERNTLQLKCISPSLGVLLDAATGYPIFMTDMSLLTSLRCAVACVLIGKYRCPRADNVLLDLNSEENIFAALAYDSPFLKHMVVPSFHKSSIEKALRVKHGSRDLLVTSWDDPVPAGTFMVSILSAQKKLQEHLLLFKSSPGVLIWRKAQLVSSLFSPKAPTFLWRDLQVPVRLPEEGPVIYTYEFESAWEDYVTLKLVLSLAEDFHVGHSLDLTPNKKTRMNLLEGIT